MTAPYFDPRARYSYNAVTGRYRDRRTGKFVPFTEIEKALAGALTGLQSRGADLAADLAADRISLGAWRTGMRELIKDAHLYSAALARGGWAALGASDLGLIGSTVRYHYGRLERFSRQIADGLPLNAQFANRVRWYVNAGRPSYYRVRGPEALRTGKRWEENVLGPSEHCSGCLEATAAGKVPIGTLVPIGQRPCKGGCQCKLRYT